MNRNNINVIEFLGLIKKEKPSEKLIERMEASSLEFLEKRTVLMYSVKTIGKIAACILFLTFLNGYVIYEIQNAKFYSNKLKNDGLSNNYDLLAIQTIYDE